MIRKAGLSDAQAIARCEKICFPLPLSETSIKDMLQNPVYQFFAAEEDSRIAGHIVLCLAGDDAEILSLAVLPKFRGRGMAKDLLTAAERFSLERNAGRLLLEVRVSNLPAITLYEKYGFTRLTRRKNFYSFPPEDGFTMKKEIKGSFEPC